MLTNCLTAHTISGHDPPASTCSLQTPRVPAQRVEHPRALPGQGRQPQRNKFNL